MPCVTECVMFILSNRPQYLGEESQREEEDDDDDDDRERREMKQVYTPRICSAILTSATRQETCMIEEKEKSCLGAGLGGGAHVRATFGCFCFFILFFISWTALFYCELFSLILMSVKCK